MYQVELDGLVIIGTVTKANLVANTKTGEIIQDLGRAVVVTSKKTFNIDLRRYERQLEDEVELQAFDEVLSNIGQTMAIRVAPRVSGNNDQYVNWTAIRAEVIEPLTSANSL